MHTVNATNVNDALDLGLSWLIAAGNRAESRNGTVLVSPCPVVTVYAKPTERVLFSPLRDANPFFHLMEALWMLAGRDDVAWPVYFNKNFGQFSDNGDTFNGAYGYRWRRHFGYDQLIAVAGLLRDEPTTRRAVLTMWDGQDDLLRAGKGANYSKDVPCNTQVYFNIQDGHLEMMVCCRSNDVIWGAYGANAVHFSVLHEWMAAAVGCKIGVMRQLSYNFHAYTDVFSVEKLQHMAGEATKTDYYTSGDCKPYPLVSTDPLVWLEDCERFLDGPFAKGLRDPFWQAVALPMYRAWHLRKEHKAQGTTHADRIAATDWCIASKQWIDRRESVVSAAVGGR
jgi:hypothetical protein